MFNKARILAIFDDLHTILLLIPLKIMLIGLQPELAMVAGTMLVLLWAAWTFLHRLRLPITWPFVLGYAAALSIGLDRLHHFTHVHLEVLLPAFVLGCVMARPAGSDPHADDARIGHEEGPESPSEQRVATIISACFMVLVGLSMPPIFTAAHGGTPPNWSIIGLHVLAVTGLSNLGKMFIVLCYRAEVGLLQRLALAVGMFPRGEVGAGVLVVSLSYGFGGDTLTVAVLSLALNLLCTGVFIVVAKKLLAASAPVSTDRAAAFPH
jgi:Kef-type K+ transport system membrane component KefB